jgi:hypothetical protein
MERPFSMVPGSVANGAAIGLLYSKGASIIINHRIRPLPQNG